MKYRDISDFHISINLIIFGSGCWKKFQTSSVTYLHCKSYKYRQIEVCGVGAGIGSGNK